MEFNRTETRYSLPDENEEVIRLKFMAKEATRKKISRLNEFDYEEIIDLVDGNTKYFTVFRKRKKNGKEEHVCVIKLEGEFIEITVIKDREYRCYEICHLKLFPHYRIPNFEEGYLLEQFCQIQFIESAQGFPADSGFVDLYNSVNQLIPTPDAIDKDREKKVWDRYVKAYQLLLDQKKQIKEARVVEIEKKRGYLRLEIIKPDAEAKVNEEIKTISDAPIEVSLKTKEPFLRFYDYQEFGIERLAELKVMLVPYFYEVKNHRNSIAALIEITENSEENRGLKLEKFQDALDKFKISCTVSSRGNCKDISLNQTEYFKRVLAKVLPTVTCEPFRYVLDMHKDDLDEKDLLKKLEELTFNSMLTREGFRPRIIKNEQKGNLFLVKSSNAQIIKEVENNVAGFIHFSTDAEFQVITKNGDKLNNVEGFKRDRNLFTKEMKYIKNDLKSYKAQLAKKFPNSMIKTRDSFFFFQYKPQPLSEDEIMKIRLALLGVVDDLDAFDPKKMTIKLSFDNKKILDKQFEKLKNTINGFRLEGNKTTSTRLVFKYDKPEEQKRILNQVENKIRNHAILSKHLEYKSEGSKIQLLYEFKHDREREDLRNHLYDELKDFSEITLAIPNELGETTIFLDKNYVKELESEKQFYRNLRDADFFYELQSENKKFEDLAIEYKENEAKIEAIKGQRRSVPKEEWDAMIRKSKQFQRKERNRWKSSLGSLVFAPFKNRKFSLIVNPDNRLDVDDILYKTLLIKPNFWGEEAIIRRMSIAMDKIMRPARPKPGFSINRNIENFLFDPSFAESIPDGKSAEYAEDYKRFKENRIEKNLNPKQEEAVLKAMHTEDLMLLQGPPGTGKTTAIAEMLWQIVCKNQASTILVSSQANLAVDNALDRLHDAGIVRPLRIGGNRIKVFSVDENGQRFEDLEKTFDKRIKYAERFEEGFKYAKIVLEIWREMPVGHPFEEDTKHNVVVEWLGRICDKVDLKRKQEPKFSNVLEKWKTKLVEPESATKKTFTDLYFKHSNIVAATCMECGTDEFSEEFKDGFDYVIVDEASKATPPELILPLTHGKACIVIGDHKQLPPMIDEKQIEEALVEVGGEQLVQELGEDVFKVSQFEKLFIQAKLNNPSIITELDTQYRMHEDIMAVINQFYIEIENSQGEMGLICGLDQHEMNQPFDARDKQGNLIKGSRDHGLKNGHLLNPETHVIWVDVKTQETKRGTTFYNQGEIDAIEKILKSIKDAPRFKQFQGQWDKEEDKEIGVITFYGAQLKELRNFAERKRGKDGRWRNYYHDIPIRIDTVDRFQGMERNILIVSTVRSNLQETEERKGQTRPNKTLGFAKDPKRINVAFSRVRRLLIIVGNKEHFSKSPLYKEVVQTIDTKGIILPAKLL